MVSNTCLSKYIYIYNITAIWCFCNMLKHESWNNYQPSPNTKNQWRCHNRFGQLGPAWSSFQEAPTGPSDVNNVSWCPSLDGRFRAGFGLQQILVSSTSLVGGWTNPSEKYARQNGYFPQIGMNIKNIWNHYLAHLFENVDSLVKQSLSLVGEANSFWKICNRQRWTVSPGIGMNINKTYLKPPPRKGWQVSVVCSVQWAGEPWERNC